VIFTRAINIGTLSSIRSTLFVEPKDAGNRSAGRCVMICDRLDAAWTERNLSPTNCCQHRHGWLPYKIIKRVHPIEIRIYV
jgi:hypothetical protein